MVIRKYKNLDIDDIMDIWLKTNIASHKFIQESYWRDNYGYVKSALPVAEIFVYEESGIIKGFVGIVDHTFIAGLFVLPEYQGMGIGKKLINECKLVCERLELCVYIKNKNATEFYKKNGFEVKEEKVDNKTQEKEYVMQWNSL